MKFLWFRCDVIIPSTALAILVIAIALGGFLLQLELAEFPDTEANCKIADSAEASLARFKSEGQSAFVLGYTGEVGRALVDELNKLKIFKRVVLIGRRKVDLNVGREFEQKVIDFDKIDEYKGLFENLEVGFCCIGTTHKKSGTTGFVKVDHDYPLMAADIAKGKGCKQFSVVTSQGADKTSSFLYIRTKGEVEEALKALRFDRLSIYRPGMLLCDRNESRPMEFVARTLLSPVAYLFPTAITTPTKVVAKSMVNNVVAPLPDKPTAVTLENKAIHQTSGISVGCPKKSVDNKVSKEK